jgi:hypothetical protein
MPAAETPIVIPQRMKHDRAIRRLLTAWLNAHARFQVCQRRVNWKTPQSRKIEKARRKEKWIVVARILAIEHQLLRWLGSATKHPDLYTAPSRGKLSRRVQLYGVYYNQRRLEHNLRGIARKDVAAARILTVATIRNLDRTWMLELLAAVYPSARMPGPLPLHPRELLPRKIARASRQLIAEVTPPPSRTIHAVATLRSA